MFRAFDQAPFRTKGARVPSPGGWDPGEAGGWLPARHRHSRLIAARLPARAPGSPGRHLCCRPGARAPADVAGPLLLPIRSP